MYVYIIKCIFLQIEERPPVLDSRNGIPLYVSRTINVLRNHWHGYSNCGVSLLILDHTISVMLKKKRFKPDSFCRQGWNAERTVRSEQHATSDLTFACLL